MPTFTLWEKQRDLHSVSYALLVFLLLFFLPSFLSAETIGVSKNIGNTSLKLLSNTDQCLTDCEAWLEWDLRLSSTSVLTPSKANLQFNFETIKKTGKEELLGFGIEVWEQKSTLVDDYCWIKTIVGKDLNDADKIETTKEKCGSHQEKEWVMVSNNFYGFSFKQQVYRLRVWGKKRASLGDQGIDWQPTILGVKVGEWAWWNGSWHNRYPVNNLVITENRLAGDLIELRNINFADMNIACIDLNDLAIINNDTSTELARATEGFNGSTTGKVFFGLDADLVAGTYNKKFYVYTNNAGCPTPEKLLLDDLNNLNAWHITDSTGGTASIDIADKNISNSIKLTNEGINDSQYIQIVSDTNFTDINVGFLMKGSHLDTKVSEVLLGALPATYGASGAVNFAFCGAACFPISANTWYYVIFERKSLTVANCYGYALDGTLLGTLINRDCSPFNWFGSTWLAIDMLDRVATPTETFLLNRIQPGVKRYIGTLVPSFAIGAEEADSKLDLNFSTLDNVKFVSPMRDFSYIWDGNLTIDFNVFNLLNSRLAIDLNYTSGLTGTSSIIVKDLNLNAGICPDQDWSDVPSTCSWDWNIGRSLVPDGNYWLIAKVVGVDFNKYSATTFLIANDVNIVVKVPIDEETGVPINVDHLYTWEVRIYDAGGLQYYSGQRDQNGFLAPIGTSIIVEVDTNTADFYPRQYTLIFNNPTATYTLQPYLIKQAVSGNFIFSVTNIATAAPISNVEIQIFGFVPALDTPNIQTIATDSAGLATIPLRLNSPYTVNFYYLGTLVHSASITPTTANLFYQVQLNIVGAIQPPPDYGAISVSFYPITGYLLQRSNGSVDINASISMLVKTIQQIRIQVFDTNGCKFNDVIFNSPWTDGNIGVMSGIDLNDGTSMNIYSATPCIFDDRFSIWAQVDVNSTDGNQFQAFSIKWQLVQENNYKYNLLYLLPNIGAQINGNNGKIATTFIAFLVLVVAVSAVGAVSGGEPIMAAMLTLAILGFFVLIEFVDPLPFAFVCIATLFGILYMWGRFG